MITILDKYTEIKKKVSQNTINFFRVGDFYEAISDDAVVVIKLLDMNYGTRTNQETGEKFKIVGIPYHSFAEYKVIIENSGFNVEVQEKWRD